LPWAGVRYIGPNGALLKRYQVDMLERVLLEEPAGALWSLDGSSKR
jgi:hypothetical protein